MTTVNFTSHTKPLGYILAAGALLTILTALAAIWTWAASPTEVVQGRLSSQASSSRVLSHSSDGEEAASEFFRRLDPNIQDHRESLTSDDPAWWWPEHIGNAALAFHCSPKTSQDTHHSVMVWTDTKYNVVAYGVVLQGGGLPAYASALADTNDPDSRQFVYPAGHGFHVIEAGKTYTLKIGDARLGCVSSYGD